MRGLNGHRVPLAPVVPRVGLIALLLLGLCIPNPGRADSPDAPIQPRRVTAGGANAYLGVPSPDERLIYFVSDDRSTTRILAQAPDQGGPRVVLSGNADVLAPRPSPDGRTLLYIGYAQDAGGDACLLDLRTGQSRCLTGPDTSDVAAFWFPDGRTIGVVQREGLHGDFVLRRLPLDGGPASDLVRANLASPAVSADGGYLAWVPLDRDSERVGINFAMRLGRGIVFHRLSDGVQMSYWPGLPGYSGFPAFSPDGRYFVFAQYLNDTNFDGRIDGGDHGVLFRVPFDASAPSPFVGPPEQLTSARFNCLYPAPGRDRLVATCSDGDNLDVYVLPLEGSIPKDWSLDRVAEQMAASRDPWELLLLMGRALVLETRPESRLARLRAMADLHTRLREHESADFYARRLGDLAGSDAPLARWAGLLRELIAHRVAEIRLVQGQLSEAFLAGERQRLARLPAADPDPDTAALARLVECEVRDVVGDEAGARRAFAAIDPARLGDPATIRMVAVRARRLLVLPQERPRLLEALRTLSQHPALPDADRLHVADAYVTTVVRGAPLAGRLSAVRDALASAPPGSELAFRLDLEQRLIPMGQRDGEAVRAEVFELYRNEKDPNRRRFLALMTVRRAASLDQDHVVYQFANTWVSGLRPGSAERPYGEALFREIVLDRGYGAQAAGDVKNARGWFWSAAILGDWPQAHSAFIEARIAEGIDDLDTTYRDRFASAPDGPAAAFVRAYRAVRTLGDPATDVDRVAADVDRDLRTATHAFPQAWEPRLLRAWVAHQHVLRRADPSLAAEALNEYGLALDLAREDPRGTATILLNLGLLQAMLGDDAAALETLARRDALPYQTPFQAIATPLARARAMFRTDRHAEAAALARSTLDTVRSDPSLAPLLPLVLDRAALYALQAGQPLDALELLEELTPLARALTGADAGITRFKVALKRASAALAADRHETALAAVQQAQGLLEAIDSWPSTAPDPLGGPPTRRVFSREDTAGLLHAYQAHALAGLGRFPEGIEAMERRRDGLVARLRRADLDEDVIELARVEYHVGLWSWAQGDRDRAVAAFENGLDRAEAYRDRTGTPVTVEWLRLVQALAQSRLIEGVPADRFRKNVGDHVRQAHDAVGKNRNPRWDADRYLLEQYRTLVEQDAAGEVR